MGFKNYCLFSGTLFGAIALAHLLRAVYGLSLTVDGYSVPMSLSWLAVVITASLAVWAFRVAGTGRRSD